MINPIKADDARYNPTRNNSGLCGETFQTYEEANRFIRSNCRYCRDYALINTGSIHKRHKCDMLHDLRLGMANDYPFWSNEFVRLDLKEEHKLKFKDECYSEEELENRLPETLIACTKFKSKQLEFAFSE